MMYHGPGAICLVRLQPLSWEKKIDQLKFKKDAVVSQKQAVDGGIAFWKERGIDQQIKPSDWAM